MAKFDAPTAGAFCETIEGVQGRGTRYSSQFIGFTLTVVQVPTV